MPEDPHPTDAPDDEDGEPIRLRAHTPLWPIAVAGVVAVLAVAVILIVRPDQAPTASPDDTSTAVSVTSAAPTSGPVSPDPNVFWVPMPTEFEDDAATLLDIWAGMDPGSVTPGTFPIGLSIESAGVDTSGTLVLHGSGAELGTGPCQSQQEVSVLENEAAVVVFVRPRAASVASSDPDTACVALAFPVELPVPLADPIGERAVLYLNQWSAETGTSPRIPLAG